MVIIQTPANSGRETAKAVSIRVSGPGIHNFPAFIIATLGTSLMGLLHFVTVRTLGEGRSLQKIMSAPLVLSRVGMTPLWIRHTNSFDWPQIA
jgi:hypothetical protein